MLYCNPQNNNIISLSIAFFTISYQYATFLLSQNGRRQPFWLKIIFNHISRHSDKTFYFSSYFHKMNVIRHFYFRQNRYGSSTLCQRRWRRRGGGDGDGRDRGESGGTENIISLIYIMSGYNNWRIKACCFVRWLITGITFF